MSHPNYNRPNTRCNTEDVHGLLAKEIYSQGVPKPNPNLVAAIKASASGGQIEPSPPYMPIKDFTFYFDSLYKSGASEPLQGQLSYSIPQLNSLVPIQNIIECRVGSFYFPNILSSGATDFFYYRRVYMKISGIVSTSSAQGINGNTYHFEFNVTNVNSTSVLLEPVNSSYYFQVPQISFNEVSFTFFAPLNFKRIPIPADQIVVQIIPGSIANDPAGNFTVINGSTSNIGAIGIPAAPGIAVFFTNFVSGDPPTDALINTEGGIYVTNIISTTTFSVNVSFVAVPVPVFPATAPIGVMTIGKNRVAFQMRFTCLDSSPKNGAIQTHV